jgi:hypothetical protein
MELFQKITTLYPELTESDFRLGGGTILLQNDSDGKGDYIAKWDHPNLARPTTAQLDAIGE